MEDLCKPCARHIKSKKNGAHFDFTQRETGSNQKERRSVKSMLAPFFATSMRRTHGICI